MLSLTTQGVLTPQPFPRGMGLCVCLYFGKCLLTCMNTLLRLMRIDLLCIPLLLLLSSFFLPFLCLCVSDSFTVVILFPAWRRTLHISCHANSATWVAVKWSMWMQTQVLTKEHTMDRQSLSTCCHLLKKSYRSICLFGLRKTTQTSFYLDALQLKSHPSIILTRRSWLVLPSPRWGAGSVLIPSPQQQSSFWC